MRKVQDGLSKNQRWLKRHPEVAEKWKAHRRAARMKWRMAQLGEGAFEHFEEQRRIQNGICAICHQLMEKACSDHNHETGKWRGLLCDCCNRGLGLLKDSVGNLESAIAYLKQWQ